MPSDVAEKIYERVKALPVEKQKEILHQIEAMENPAPASSQSSIWQKIRARANSIPDEVWDALPVDGSEHHDHYLYGTPKK